VKRRKTEPIIFLVTVGGLGYIPRMPGTLGTVIAIPLSLGLNRVAEISLPGALAVLIGFIACAIWLAAKAADILRQKDPPMIVIDEIAGFLVANFLSAPRLGTVIAAFALFRFFDIAKIFPASRFELFPGGAGIVLDDVVAGLYAFTLLRLAEWWSVL
jgi:phosphatidylglycerophosphatase A